MARVLGGPLAADPLHDVTDLSDQLPRLVVHRVQCRTRGGIKLSITPATGKLTVRVTTAPRSTCVLMVLARKKSATFPRFRTSIRGKARISWSVPKDAPSGRWTFTVSCTKNARTRSAKRRVLIITGGSGKGGLVVPSSSQLGQGAVLVSDGKGSSAGQSCASDVNGGTVCFANNPFADYGATAYCTWYAAGRRPDLYNIARRNAYQWPADVAGRVPTGTVPVVGAIAVWAAGSGSASSLGHVAYVTAVTNGGTTVVVDEANWVPLKVSYGRRVPARDISSYIYGGPAGSPADATPGQPGSFGGTADGDRIGIVYGDGTLAVKEAGIAAPFTTIATGAAQVELSGDRIAARYGDGTVAVKEGAVGAGFTTIATGAAQVVIAGTRIAVRYGNGTVAVKEGAVGAGFTTIATGAADVDLNGDRIAVRYTDGTVAVKEGAVGAGFTTIAAGAAQVDLSGDRIAVLYGNGTAAVKEGTVGAGFTTIATGAAQVDLVR